MKKIKTFNKFNESYDKIIDTDRVNNIESTNKHIRSLNKNMEDINDTNVSNMNKYGTIKVGSSPDTEFVLGPIEKKNGSYKKEKIFVYDIRLIPKQDIDSYEIGGNYNSSSFFGILVKTNLNGNLISIDEEMDEESTQKVLNYINNSNI